MRERAAFMALGLMGAHLLAAGSAAAAPPSCIGTDRIAALQHDDPLAYQRLVDAASSFPNGEGLLWRIGKPGLPPSYLFGTMHVTDERLAQLPGEVVDALAASRTVALELAEVAGPAAEQKAMQATIAARGIDTDGQALRSIDPSDRAVVVDALAERGVSAQSAQRMRPWMLLSLLSVPSCEIARAQAGMPSIDARIGSAGKQAGAAIIGLETVDEQIDALASISPQPAARLAVGIARLGRSFDDVFETMIGLYRRRQIGLFFGDLDIVGVPAGDVGAFAEFMTVLIEKRNALMADRAVPLIERGRAFIAVGALHLVGKNGVVELLRSRGYTLTRVW